MQNIPMNFPITIFDNVEEKVSETLTKKRCAIFYKGKNRNRGYITDEFAEKLMSTIPYAPVKGIYDEDTEDFTNHGASRDLGRIYGVVPVDNNFAWEKHLDPDGVEREYACVDVYLYTAIYKEANEIDGKAQSMELFPPSIKGKWDIINGESVFKYTDAAFLGLQVLGEEAIPCFQGSSFFSLNNEQALEVYTLLLDKIEEFSIGGEKTMENENIVSFALSDNQKQSKIGKALNQETFRYWVMDTYEDCAIVFDYETEEMYKVGFTVNEDETVTVNGAETFEKVSAVYVTAEEKAALNEFKCAKNKNFTEIVNEFNANEQTIVDLHNEIDNKVNEISTLTTDKENLNTIIADKDAEIVKFTATITELQQFKTNVETNEKQAVLNKFSVKIDEDTLKSYAERLGEFTVTDLEKELSYEVVKNDESIFTASDNGGYVPQEQQLTGLEALLTKYKK